MTPRQVLAGLSDHHIRLRCSGDRLLASPRGNITPELAEIITANKDGLCGLLNEYRDAIRDAFANPSTREDIGPLWMTDDWN
jgi:hypothetical protein